jgi:RNA polymerase sigma-70 factor (ECF subfamily)
MDEEHKLIKRAKNGEGEAFGALYDRYLTPIYRYIFLRVGSNKANAEDLTHQVFLSAWQNIKSYEFKGFPFSSWLYRIAHNAVIDYYRTSKVHIDINALSSTELVESPDFQIELDKRADLAKIKSAIAKLETDQQNVIIMKFVNDLTNKEIAKILGKSEGAVRVIQHRALKKLKDLIGLQDKENNGKGHYSTIA